MNLPKKPNIENYYSKYIYNKDLGLFHKKLADLIENMIYDEGDGEEPCCKYNVRGAEDYCNYHSRIKKFEKIIEFLRGD